MRKFVVILALALAARLAGAQSYDPGVISPYLENPTDPLAYVFTSYAGGAPYGGYYYHFPTNITGYYDSPENYRGECVYYWPELFREKEIAEDVIIYRGTNTLAAFSSGTPFTVGRTASPCFDGRWGEVSEAANRTWAYGGGDTNYSAAKNRYYLLVNRVRGRHTPPGRHATGGSWSLGDFREVFIGAKEHLLAAWNTGVGTSGRCRGEAVATTHPDYCTNDAFAWKISPLVKISAIGATTYSTLTPVVSEVNSWTTQISLFNNIPAGTILFGFMKFGPITEGPNRIAAVAITDSSTTIRPSNAVLYYRSGGVYVAATGGTMAQVPDNVSTTLGSPYDIHDLEWDPVLSTWFLFTRRGAATTAGCANDGSPGFGTEFVQLNLHTLSSTGFWASQNDLGRFTIDAHFLGSDQFILYSSTDRRCITGNPPGYQQDTGILQWRSMEVMVRNKAFGPPN